MNQAAVVVVGSLNRDYVCRVETLPARGQTVLATQISVGSGGKGGNQAVAACLAGARTVMIGDVGEDEDGRALLTDLEAAGVDVARVDVLPGVATGRAFVTVGSDGENLIVVAPGANERAAPGDVTARLAPLLVGGTVVVTQAEIPLATVEAVLTAAVGRGCRAILNLAPFHRLPDEVLALCDPLVVNESEAAALLGREVSGVAAARDAALQINGMARSVVLTVGPHGAVVAGAGLLAHVPAGTVEVVDTTGAGDAFTGALAASLGEGHDLLTAVRFGVRAGSYAVTRAGAQASYARRADLFGDPGTVRG